MKRAFAKGSKRAKLPDRILVTTSASGMRSSSPKPLKLGVLENNVNIFLAQMDSIVSKAPDTVSKFHLDEFTVTVEISAKGEISILGTGTGAEVKGGVEFKFKRS
jgi:hypothetical protein